MGIAASVFRRTVIDEMTCPTMQVCFLYACQIQHAELEFHQEGLLFVEMDTRSRRTTTRRSNSSSACARCCSLVVVRFRQGARRNGSSRAAASCASEMSALLSCQVAGRTRRLATRNDVNHLCHFKWIKSQSQRTIVSSMTGYGVVLVSESNVKGFSWLVGGWYGSGWRDRQKMLHCVSHVFGSTRLTLSHVSVWRMKIWYIQKLFVFKKCICYHDVSVPSTLMVG